jgi:hypothetical protein
VKRWHGYVVAVAVVAIVAYLAMIVGPRYYPRHRATPRSGVGQRAVFDDNVERTNRAANA